MNHFLIWFQLFNARTWERKKHSSTHFKTLWQPCPLQIILIEKPQLKIIGFKFIDLNRNHWNNVERYFKYSWVPFWMTFFQYSQLKYVLRNIKTTYRSTHNKFKFGFLFLLNTFLKFTIIKFDFFLIWFFEFMLIKTASWGLCGENEADKGIKRTRNKKRVGNYLVLGTIYL